jgi:hypothetical protein
MERERSTRRGRHASHDRIHRGEDRHEAARHPLWSPEEDPQFTSEPYIKAAVERSAASIQPSSDEKLVLRHIKTATGPGHYFRATDRAPAEGEFKYMASGVVPAGRLLLSFTVLSHDGKPTAMDGALEIVRSAAHQ